MIESICLKPIQKDLMILVESRFWPNLSFENVIEESIVHSVELDLQILM